MRRARAKLVSAAILLAPGCGGAGPTAPSPEEPLRRAHFRSLAARDFLMTCAGAAGGAQMAAIERHEELKQLGLGKDAGHALWLGENDWAAVRRLDERKPCVAGEAPFRQALSAYGATLDTLARRIAEYRGAAR